MELQHINEDIYEIAPSDSSSSISLTKSYGPNAKAIFYNGSDQDVFVVSGVTAPTAVFPTSESTPVKGKIIPAGSVMTFKLPQDDLFISCIQASAGTGSLFVGIGEGV